MAFAAPGTLRRKQRTVLSILSELIRSVGFRSSAETGAEFLFELFLLAGYAWDPDGNFVR